MSLRFRSLFHRLVMAAAVSCVGAGLPVLAAGEPSDERAADDTAANGATDDDTASPSSSAVTDDSAQVADRENVGQGDLDEAMRLRVTAQSMADLERIIELGESAIRKGLDDDNRQFAQQMVAAGLYQHAMRLSQGVLDVPGGRQPDPRLRNAALNDLKKAISYDDNVGEFHLLRARIEGVAGNVEQAREAVNRAVELFDQPELKTEHSTALVIRGGLTEDAEQRLADFSKAIELNPQNLDAWARARDALRSRKEIDRSAGRLERTAET